MKRLISIILVIALTAAAVVFMIPTASAVDFDNKYDFLTSYCGYITAKDEKYYNIEHLTTDYIQVAPGNSITAGPFVSGQKLYVSYYDKDKKLISQITDYSQMTVVDTLTGGQTIAKIKYNGSVSYIRLTFGAEYYNTFLVTINQSFGATEFNSWVASQGYTKYIDFINSNKSSFSTKELLWCGDSVGHGSYEKKYEGAALAGLKSGAGYAYAGRVADLLGFKSYKNTSTGGATITTKYPSNIISQKIEKNANSKTEYLIIEGGIVDVCGYNEAVVPIGYLSDSFDPTTFADKSTFIGGLEYNFYLATTKSPNAVIVFVMCYELYSSKTGQFAWDRIWQYVEPVCEKWGIPIIDLYNNKQVRKIIERDPAANSFFYYDALHCTPHGYTVTSLEIAMELQNIGKYSASNQKKPTSIPAEYAKDTWDKLDPGSADVYITDPINKFDANTAIAGYLDTDGKATGTDKYISSGLISVNPGDKVYLGPESPYLVCVILGYDKNKKVSTEMHNSLNMDTGKAFSSGYELYSYTVPENTYYIRVTFTNNVTPLVTVNEPITIDKYNELLYEAIRDKKSNLYGTPTNLFDETKIQFGALTENGELNNDKTMKTSDFIEISALGSTIFTGPFNSSDDFVIYTYNVFKQVITSGLASNLMSVDRTYSDGSKVYSYTLPTNVQYIRISAPTGSLPYVTVNRSFTELEYSIQRPETTIAIPTDAPVEDTEAPGNTPSEDKKGCKSFIGISIIPIITVIPFVIKKKKRQ